MNETLVVPGIVVSVVLAILGWLLLRAIGGVDKRLAELGVKVDALAQKDGQLSESMVELRVRLTHVETEQASMRSLLRGRRKPESEAG